MRREGDSSGKGTATRGRRVRMVGVGRWLPRRLELNLPADRPNKNSIVVCTHEVVKHMITFENTFDWYNTESNLRRVYMYVSIALAS